MIGVYRDVVTGPNASFWCPLESSFEPTRFSEMIWDAGGLKDDINAQRFVVDDLGR